MVDQYGRWFPDYPGQQPFQDPAYLRAMNQQPGQGLQQQQQQNTKMVEVVPAASEKAVLDFPVERGNTKLFMAKDDSFIGIKSVDMAGKETSDFYDRRPPAPPPAELNPDDYVRKDEIAALVAEIMQEQNARKRPAAKKEET